MAVISSDQVKHLREKTGAGMMDCKRALEESNGDVEAAIEYLRKKGAATAAKRADRETNQGVVEAYIHAGGGIVADSVPEEEYKETSYKAQAMLEAVKS